MNPLLTLQHPAKASSIPRPDSECYTEATPSVSGSDCEDSDIDVDTDVSVACGRVEEGLGQAEVQDVPVVPPKLPRRGLRSHITLGEEIL